MPNAWDRWPKASNSTVVFSESLKPFWTQLIFSPRSEFGVNYNKESEQFRKGTTLYRKKVELPVIDIGIGAGDNQVTTNEGDEGKQKANSKCKQVKTKVRTVIEETTCDIIQDEFWDKNPNLLNKTSWCAMIRMPQRMESELCEVICETISFLNVLFCL